jgi:LPXTG-motif cell wall-anchored protein
LPVTVANTPLVFQSTALTDYVKTKAGTAASFAVRMATCGGAASPTVLIYDMENGSPALASGASSAPASPDAMTQPHMTISAPSAVALSTFQATDSAVNWPLIAGLAALAALLVGVLVYRRRAIAR